MLTVDLHHAEPEDHVLYHRDDLEKLFGVVTLGEQDPNDKERRVTAEVKFFMHDPDECEALAKAFTDMAESLRDAQNELLPKQCGACDGSGMGMTPESRCHVCAGQGEY